MMPKFKQSGFSLVETLVSITILLLVIAGPLAIISSASNSSMFASDQVAAFLLAQEGAELAQKARDDLVIAKFNNPAGPDPWATFTDTTSGTYRNCFTTVNGPGCGLEFNSSNNVALRVTTCSSADARVCQLNYNSNTANRSRFTHISTGNEFSGFSRSITFYRDSVLYPQEVRVVSRVTWFSGTTRNEREVEVETYLFDVYGN